MTKKISWWRTTFAHEEIARMTRAVEQENLSQGPVTAEFERGIAEMLGVPYVVATTSGSVALFMAMVAAGVKPGDEVIVPNRGWIAAAHAARLLGATVVLVDVVREETSIDPARIAERITPKTRAIVSVHLNGRSTDMAAINAMAASHGVTVIEDGAQALLSRNTLGLLGCQSPIGCFSLSVAKLISTGQGGFIVTHDEQTHRRLSLMRSHGVVDVVHAQWTELGFNFRMSDVLAAIGIAQIDRIPGRIERLHAIYGRYDEALKGLKTVRMIPVDVAAGEIPLYVEVLCDDRPALQRYLAERNVETRPFHPDLNVAGYLDNPGAYPNSDRFATHGLFLPCGPSQVSADIDRVIEHLQEFDTEHRYRLQNVS